jgi:hypothetical protein
MAGEVVDLLDGDAEVQHSWDEGVAEVMGRKVTCQFELSDIKFHVKD